MKKHYIYAVTILAGILTFSYGLQQLGNVFNPLTENLDANGWTITGIASMVSTGPITCASINTGQGYNLCYAMNQDVRTSDAPTFAGLNLTSTMNSLGKMIVAYNLTSASADGDAVFMFTSTGMATGNAGQITSLRGVYNWYGGDNATFTAEGVEGVVRARAVDVNMTGRGVSGRIYAGTGFTMHTGIGGEFAYRIEDSNHPTYGSSYAAIRGWMYPGWQTNASTNVVNNYGLWLYNEHATNAVTNAIKIDKVAGGGGFTKDISLQNGATIDNSTLAMITLSTNTTVSGNLTATGNVAISSCVVTGTVGNVLTTNGAVFFGGNATLKLNADLVFGNGETINNDTDGSISFTNNGSASLSLVHGSEAYFSPAANIPFGINAPSTGQGIWLRAGINKLELNTTTGKIQFGGTTGAKSWLYGNSGYTIWAGSMAVASEQVYASTFTPNSFDCGTDITALTKTIKGGFIQISTGTFTAPVGFATPTDYILRVSSQNNTAMFGVDNNGKVFGNSFYMTATNNWGADGVLYVGGYLKTGRIINSSDGICFDFGATIDANRDIKMINTSNMCGNSTNPLRLDSLGDKVYIASSSSAGNWVFPRSIKTGSKTSAELKVYTPVEIGEIWGISDVPNAIVKSTGTTVNGFIEYIGTTPTY